jgi:thiol-disulfide isomerase/thioredoxin
MRKASTQWVFVGVIIAGLVLGAWALVKYGPVPTGAEVGQRAPDFRAVNLASGDSVTFYRNYKGTVTLVNVWATWCAPCRAEMPAMQRLYDRLKDKGFRIAAVSIDNSGPNDVQAFAKELGLSFDILHDKSGVIQEIYQTTGVPESFLVDKNGVIVRKQIGEHPWSSPANQRIVAELLGITLDPADTGATASPAEIRRGPGG